MIQSEQCAINSFLKETMHELFKLYLLVILNGVSIYFYIYMFQWYWVGWWFPVVAASTLLCYSVWVCGRPVIVLLFDCRRASLVDWPLLQQLGFSLHDYLSRWSIGLQPQAVTFDGRLLMSLTKPFKWKNRAKLYFLPFLILGDKWDFWDTFRRQVDPLNQNIWRHSWKILKDPILWNIRVNEDFRTGREVLRNYNCCKNSLV